MMKSVIIDDEPGSAGIIDSMVKKYFPEIEVTAICIDIPGAVKEIETSQPDIIFLDIELRDGLGFEILEQANEIKGRVIFISAYEHYAIKAIKFHAFDYISKPVNPEEFKISVKKVLEDINIHKPAPVYEDFIQKLKDPEKSRIAVPLKNGYQNLNTDDIIIIQADGSYSTLFLTNKNTLMVSRMIKDFEKVLLKKNFIRVHKSYLVNMEHIIEFHRDESGYLLMSNQKKVPISPMYKDHIIFALRGLIDFV